MIIKAVFYVGGTDHSVRHERVLEVYDFHIETRKSEDIETSSSGKHELIYHTTNGNTGTLHLGHHPEHADYLYVMENGKTVDRMTFNS